MIQYDGLGKGEHIVVQGSCYESGFRLHSLRILDRQVCKQVLACCAHWFGLYGGRMFRREHLYAIGLCDRPVPASQRVGWGALLNGILNPGISLVSGLSRRGLIVLDGDGEG